MKQCFFLEDDDVLESGDFWRPTIRSADFDTYSDSWQATSEYSGSPRDTLLWVRVSETMKPWIGKTVGFFRNQKFQDGQLRFKHIEFIRGEPEKDKINPWRLNVPRWD